MSNGARKGTLIAIFVLGMAFAGMLFFMFFPDSLKSQTVGSGPDTEVSPTYAGQPPKAEDTAIRSEVVAEPVPHTGPASPKKP
jgi:hypothetical protein